MTQFTGQTQPVSDASLARRRVIEALYREHLKPTDQTELIAAPEEWAFWEALVEAKDPAGPPFPITTTTKKPGDHVLTSRGWKTIEGETP